MFARKLLPLLFVTCIAACGGGGGSGDPEPAQADQGAWPAVPAPAVPARLSTLIGSLDADGLHWIIAGDGFTAAQMSELRDAALSVAREMIHAPELANHSSIWNVHLLEAGSRESGVDDAARGVYVDTAFDGQLGCGSNSRVACVSWEKIDAALRAQGAPRAELTVILNTQAYVGSANASGVIVSRNEHAPRIVVHEMGHRVAGLADEYVDAVVADEWRPLYLEGRFANVTKVAAADQAPWRHWAADSSTGVGLYEGAFYEATGFYRPKRDSIMRTLEAPLGEVNAEAWLRAQYRALPPFSSVSPAVTQVLGVAGETLEFSVVCPWPRDALSVGWFVDGVEIPEARDTPVLHFLADGGVHQVEVRASDATGRIRSPEATESRAAHAWRVSADLPAAGEKSAQPPRSPAGPSTWMLMRVDDRGHAVITRDVQSPPGWAMPAHDDPDWNYSLLDGNDAVITSGVAHDPRIMRSAMSEPGSPQAGHALTRSESGIYYIEVPRGSSPRKLRISTDVGGQEKTGSASATHGPIEIELDSP
jgi:hypothetical protein